MAMASGDFVAAMGRSGCGKSTLRNLLAVLIPLWPVDAVLVLRSRQRRRLGDLLTGTTVRRVAR